MTTEQQRREINQALSDLREAHRTLTAEMIGGITAEVADAQLKMLCSATIATVEGVLTARAGRVI